MNNDFLFVEKLITNGIPDAQVFIEDMTGTKDHLQITVVSDAFEGKLLFQQHQMLMNLLKEELQNRIHAVKLHTYSKAKFSLLNKG